MKKNKIFRIASVLLVATLLSTCAISSTFAKYVTSGSTSDDARVAKFGVNIEGSSDMFKTEYAKSDSNYTGTLSVQSSSDDNLVAPGTSGSLVDFTITGAPEVAVRVTYAVDTLTFENWADADSAYYCPIVITVHTSAESDPDKTFSGLDYSSADDFAAAIKEAIEGSTYDYDPNTDLSEKTADNLGITWAWAFAGDDVKDTALGDAAAEGTAATIAIGITCTITQID